MTYKYSVFGLNFESELESKELPVGKPIAKTDVCIRFGKVPDKIEAPLATGLSFQAVENKFLLVIDDIAKFLVQNGNEIIIEVIDEKNLGSIRLFLYGSVMGALLFQNGFVVLHSSAVEINNKAVLFAGSSGSGKSTMSAVFNKLGYKVLADNLCPVKFNEENLPILYTGGAYMKIWHDVLSELNSENSEYEKVRPAINKFYLKSLNNNLECTYPLEKIYILSEWNRNKWNFQNEFGFKKVELLLQASFRKRFLKGFNMLNKYHSDLSKLAKSLNVAYIKRPAKKFSFDETVKIINEKIIK